STCVSTLVFCVCTLFVISDCCGDGNANVEGDDAQHVAACTRKTEVANALSHTRLHYTVDYDCVNARTYLCRLIARLDLSLNIGVTDAFEGGYKKIIVMRLIDVALFYLAIEKLSHFYHHMLYKKYCIAIGEFHLPYAQAIIRAILFTKCCAYEIQVSKILGEDTTYDLFLTHLFWHNFRLIILFGHVLSWPLLNMWRYCPSPNGKYLLGAGTIAIIMIWAACLSYILVVIVM
ncbi:hypothetical protein ACJX0J_025583, partial [Zea mays]